MEFKKNCVVRFENVDITLDNIKKYCDMVLNLNCWLNDLGALKIPYEERMFSITCNEEVYNTICDILKSVWLEQVKTFEKLLPDHFKKVILDEGYSINGVYIKEVGVCHVEQSIIEEIDFMEITFWIKDKETKQDVS